MEKEKVEFEVNDQNLDEEDKKKGSKLQLLSNKEVKS